MNYTHTTHTNTHRPLLNTYSKVNEFNDNVTLVKLQCAADTIKKNTYSLYKYLKIDAFFQIQNILHFMAIFMDVLLYAHTPCSDIFHSCRTYWITDQCLFFCYTFGCLYLNFGNLY